MIYLDNNSTTQTDKDAATKAFDLMVNNYGNPSSLHHFGMDAYQSLLNARYQVSRIISAKTEDIYFTSGGTESNNIAIRGAAMAEKGHGHHIVTTSIEHSSVLQCCRALEKEGFSVTYINPNPVTHTICASDIINAIREDTILLSVMQVNNETGELLPLEEIIQGVRDKNPSVKIHCDAVQGYGKIPLKTYALDLDFISASGHKIHAPKGIGLLYIKSGRQVIPLKYGGSQECRVNPGTENVPLACSFGIAAEKKILNMQKHFDHVLSLKKHLTERLSGEFGCIHINSPENSSPYVINFSVLGHQSSEVVDYMSMTDIYVSAGSACSKGSPSHVLAAAGYSRSIVSSALRISFSEYNTLHEIDTFADTLHKALK